MKCGDCPLLYKDFECPRILGTKKDHYECTPRRKWREAESKQKTLRALITADRMLVKEIAGWQKAFRRMRDLWQEANRMLLEAKEKIDFYKSPCPEERGKDEPGYSQGEARFWHEMYEDLKKIEERWGMSE